jgi:CheY-like chemotaxis protein
MSAEPAGLVMPKVMLVDDDEDVREILGFTLMKNNFNVQVCESGMQAVATISPDTRIVILDVMMPGMDGAETYIELQKKVPGVPIIFYSAYRALLDPGKLGDHKPLAFVEKGRPGSRDVVLEWVKKVVIQGS